MLEKLFTSKNRVKILKHLLFEKGESHLREMSRELKMPVSAVKKEVDNLFSVGLIDIQKNKISLNKKCGFLEDLKNIFIKTDYAVYPIQDALKKIKADFIFIFGSFANGSYSNESDIDLMIIGDNSLFEITKKLKPAENKIGRDINPIVWKIGDLKDKKSTGFVRDMFAKKIIMIKGDENELRKIVR